MSAENDSNVPEPGADQPELELDAELGADVPAAEGAGAGDGLLNGVDAELEISMLRVERDEYLDALRRLQADFENFRKRTQRHEHELATRAGERLIEALLPVLDAFDLALSHAREVAAHNELTAAFAQIGELLRSTLAREGLERIGESGAPFDPTEHDAVAREEADGDDEARGVVVEEVLRAGYRLHGRAPRPAMVKVRG